MEDASLGDFVDGADDGSSDCDSGTGTAESDATTETDASSNGEPDAPSGEETGSPTGGTDADGERRTDSGAGHRVDPSTVEPAESTYAWTTDGSVCEGCGETVERRWRSDDGLVCPDCKEW